MKIALCNEVLAPLTFTQACDFAASVGYDGLEVAPFTLGERPHALGEREVAALRRSATDAGIEITSLHWLLVAPPGLSITSADATVRRDTLDVIRGLIDLCAGLGGTVMVHGSPEQRRLDPDDPDGSRARGEACFASVAGYAEAAGITYCIEPLSREETAFVNTVAEAAEVVARVGSPALRTMIDTRAATLAEHASIPDLIDEWLPAGVVRHVHVNDPSQLGPGQGAERFASVFAALERHAYVGTVAVEPFIYRPDGAAAAARAVGYIRGILETLAWQGGESPARGAPSSPNP